MIRFKAKLKPSKAELGSAHLLIYIRGRTALSLSLSFCFFHGKALMEKTRLLIFWRQLNAFVYHSIGLLFAAFNASHPPIHPSLFLSLNEYLLSSSITRGRSTEQLLLPCISTLFLEFPSTIFFFYLYLKQLYLHYYVEPYIIRLENNIVARPMS